MARGAHRRYFATHRPSKEARLAATANGVVAFNGPAKSSMHGDRMRLAAAMAWGACRERRGFAERRFRWALMSGSDQWPTWRSCFGRSCRKPVGSANGWLRQAQQLNSSTVYLA